MFRLRGLSRNRPVLMQLVALRRQLAEVDRRLGPVESGVGRLTRSDRQLISARLEVTRLDYEPRELLLQLDGRSTIVRRRACAKEPWTVAWIERDVGPGEVLYDVGANSGPYSLIAASAGKGRHVVALEPAAPTYASLVANVALNELADHISPLPVALSDATGVARLDLHSLEPGDALHTLEDVPVRYTEAAPVLRQPALTYRLDDLVERLAVPFPNHLKIDVDGAELAVIRGGARTLADPRVKSVLAEIEVSLGEEILERLAAAGLPLAERHQRDDADRHWYGVFRRA